MEVDDDWEAKRSKVSHAAIVHKVFTSEKCGSLNQYRDVIEPKNTPYDLCQMESIVVKTLEWTVEVCLSLTIDLQRDEIISPISIIGLIIALNSQTLSFILSRASLFELTISSRTVRPKIFSKIAWFE